MKTQNLMHLVLAGGGVPCDEPNLWDAYDWDGGRGLD